MSPLRVGPAFEVGEVPAGGLTRRIAAALIGFMQKTLDEHESQISQAGIFS